MIAALAGDRVVAGRPLRAISRPRREVGAPEIAVSASGAAPRVGRPHAARLAVEASTRAAGGHFGPALEGERHAARCPVRERGARRPRARGRRLAFGARRRQLQRRQAWAAVGGGARAGRALEPPARTRRQRALDGRRAGRRAVGADAGGVDPRCGRRTGRTRPVRSSPSGPPAAPSARPASSRPWRLGRSRTVGQSSPSPTTGARPSPGRGPPGRAPSERASPYSRPTPDPLAATSPPRGYAGPDGPDVPRAGRLTRRCARSGLGRVAGHRPVGRGTAARLAGSLGSPLPAPATVASTTPSGPRSP